MLLYRIPYNKITVSHVSIEDFVLNFSPRDVHFSLSCDIFINKGNDRSKLRDKTFKRVFFSVPSVLLVTDGVYR